MSKTGTSTGLHELAAASFLKAVRKEQIIQTVTFSARDKPFIGLLAALTKSILYHSWGKICWKSQKSKNKLLTTFFIDFPDFLE